jgi:hypothetical protein
MAEQTWSITISRSRTGSRRSSQNAFSDVLHRDPGPPVGGDVRVVHLRHAGVVQVGEDLPLDGEAREHLLGIEPRLDQLQRHLATNRSGLLGEEDDPHPPLAQTADQPVRPDRLERRRRGADPRLRRFQEAVAPRGVAIGQQRLDIARDPGRLGAQHGEPRRQLARLHLERPLEVRADRPPALSIERRHLGPHLEKI